MQKHTQTRHHPAITPPRTFLRYVRLPWLMQRYPRIVLATEHIRSKKGAHVGSTGSFSLLSPHQRDDVRVSRMKFTL
jgi:hypothetical protein